MSWVSQVYRLSRKLNKPSAWALAFVLFAASVAARVLLEPWIEPLKFLTFYPAIAASTLLCGWLQGTVVLILSALVAWYFYFEPVGSFAIPDASTIVAIVGFLLVGGFLVLLIAGLVELVDRLENAKPIQTSLFRELQHRVANNLTDCRRNSAKRTPGAAQPGDRYRGARQRLKTELPQWRNCTVVFTTEPRWQEVLSRSCGTCCKTPSTTCPVKTRLSVPKDLGLSMDQITAIVLLVNEAAINAAKHVFRKGEGNIL